MRMFNSVPSSTTADLIRITDVVEVDNLNEFFEANFGEYYVKLDNNKYVKVIGVRKNRTFKVM